MFCGSGANVQTENQICTEISRLVIKNERVPDGVCLVGGDNATWTSGRDCSRLHDIRGRLAIGLHDTNVMGRPAQTPYPTGPGASRMAVAICSERVVAAATDCPRPHGKGGLKYVHLHISGRCELYRSGFPDNRNMHNDFDVPNGQKLVTAGI